MPAMGSGVSVEPGRIEVRFSGAKDAVGRLVEGDAASGGGEVWE